MPPMVCQTSHERCNVSSNDPARHAPARTDSGEGSSAAPPATGSPAAAAAAVAGVSGRTRSRRPAAAPRPLEARDGLGGRAAAGKAGEGGSAQRWHGAAERLGGRRFHNKLTEQQPGGSREEPRRAGTGDAGRGGGGRTDGQAASVSLPPRPPLGPSADTSVRKSARPPRHGGRPGKGQPGLLGRSARLARGE